ncbi:hypothetical protein [Methanosarcina barkeri]|uniref:hypothetical protein n=1 Tax=Methanosarcina barkeri TaxID=2208 RepID=UPI000A60DE81|nr:hypothetical protein [Methanosarcina barkeri]
MMVDPFVAEFFGQAFFSKGLQASNFFQKGCGQAVFFKRGCATTVMMTDLVVAEIFGKPFQKRLAVKVIKYI